LTVAIVAVVGVAFYGAMEYTSDPDFCASCHLMETRHVTWKRDVHSETTDCIVCHSEPGYLNEIKAHASATRYLWVLATGNSSGPILHGEAPDAACLDCHEEPGLPESVAVSAPLTGGGHLPAHGAHIDRDVSCTSCHYQPSFHVTAPEHPMSSCVDCHAEKAIEAPDCQRCHKGAVPLTVPGQLGYTGP
jgi:hypothetical protein